MSFAIKFTDTVAIGSGKRYRKFGSDHNFNACDGRLSSSMMAIGRVPTSFGQSYTVPILKTTVNVYIKSVSVDDFRGISISSVISKVFEHCILDRYGGFLLSSDNQFGFKKSSCTNAIYTLRSVVGYYVNNGSTVNTCALDISKAFDKMNHHGLFLKLVQKQIL